MPHPELAAPTQSEAHDTVADALAALAETRDGGFGVVLRGEDGDELRRGGWGQLGL